ncbi:MAG: phenazine biosynthesis protein PhzF [Gammaproteobacteria bacterium]|nr:MAG: phenazine biosynthesis protein PhzF [Gammaproteobacteria bacterium]
MKQYNSTTGTLHRLSSFTNDPQGGNPAGVWIGNKLPEPEHMQSIATEVGFSETAFVAPTTGNNRQVRYFSPEAEVAFCGHATIALGVALGETSGDDVYQLSTAIGEIPVTVKSMEGIRQASLVSIEPKFEIASDNLLKEALKALNWSLDELDSSIPPARAFAGVWHLVIAVESKHRLDNLDYDFEALKSLMLEDNLTTLQLIWQESSNVIHSRNPFPVGGVVEDPATGAAAVALGGYLRDAKLISAPAKITIRQGEVMGRPSLLLLEIPESGGVTVSGTAVPLTIDDNN